MDSSWRPCPPKGRLTEEYREDVETVARLREARWWANTHEAEHGPIAGISVYPIEKKTNRFIGRTTDGQIALVAIERATDNFANSVTFNYIDPHYELLLAKGAGVKLKSHLGYTPLSLAADNGHALTVKVLLAAGAEVNTVSPSSQDAKEHLPRAHDVASGRLNRARYAS